MALPMYIFYEVGIVSAGIFNKKKKAEEAGAALVPAMAAAGPTIAKPGPSVPSGAGDSEYVGVPSGSRRR